MADARHSQDEAIERVRSLLVETLAGVSSKPLHAYDVLRFYASERERLDVAEEVIGGSAEQVFRIVREAEMILLKEPELLTAAHGRIELLRAWAEVLFRAATEIEREDKWGELYAAEPNDDGGFAAASAARAGSTWPID